MPHMRKNLAIRMADTPASPFTTRLKAVAEALGLFCHSDLPDDALDKRSREDAWNGKLGTKHKHVARSLYDGLWKAAGGDAVIGWNGAMPVRFREGATYNKRALELLGTRDSFIALAEKQFKEGGRRRSCGTNGSKGQSRSGGDSPLLEDTTTKSLRADLHAKLSRAQVLHARDDNKEAIALLEEVYHAARSHGLKEQQLEAALNLGFTTSDRHDFKVVERRLRDAEKLIRDVKTPWHQIQYYRLKAKVLRHKKHLTHAEKALQKAVALSKSDDADVVQVGLLARASYVHLLCGEKRADEAEDHIVRLRKVVEKDDDSQPVALLAESLEACIHWAASKGDMKQVNAFVVTALRHGSGREAAICIGHTLHDCANGLRGMKATEAAVICADAAERLGHIAQRSDMALAAGFTAAGALAESGDYPAARERCIRLLEKSKGVAEPLLRSCVTQLLSQTSRQLGDKTTAIEMAEAALRDSEGDVIALCLARMALAEALRDSGKVKEAIEHARAADHLSAHADAPPEWNDQVLALIGECAALLGDWDTAETIPARLRERSVTSSSALQRRRVVENQIQMHKMIRESLTSVISAKAPLAVAGTEDADSVQAANTTLVKGLITGWLAFPNAAEKIYDFWGRGNLLRAMLNMRAFPQSFNVTLEVHTVEEARQAIRLWALLADVLVLIWKGPTVSSSVITPVPRSFFDAGGGGYIATICGESPQEMSRTMNLGVPRVEIPSDGPTPTVMTHYASLLPPEVGRFLTEEAMPLVATGRLLVVPATGICCVGSGHGPLESLFAEACNAIPAIKGDAARLPASWVPYFPDIPLGALADVAHEHETSLRSLRLLLFRKTRQLRGSGVTGAEAKELELEIQDSLAQITDTQSGLRRKHGWSEAREAVATRYDGFSEEHVAPILVLQSMGYRWRVEPTFGAPPSKSILLPKDDEPVGTWLHPADTKPGRLSEEQLRDIKRQMKRKQR